jgi:hypothetical protein
MSASRNFLPEGCPVNSPWGEVQHATRFVDGIYSVSTAGHGGFKVSDEFNRLIPEPFRADGGWYEEDCDWAAVVFFIQVPFRENGKITETIKAARSTLRVWRWREWEKYFGDVIPPGESSIKDTDVFQAAHTNDFIVISAYGDWHPNVPAGYVGVEATRGGRSPGYYKLSGEDAVRQHDPERAFFLVLKDDYRSKRDNCQGCFVIDTDSHLPWIGPAKQS